MTIDNLRKLLCRDLLVSHEHTEFGSVAVTSFSYPNGDSVNLYFSDLGNSLVVSDEGATLAFLRSQGVELPPERRHTIKTMCRPYEVEFATPDLRREFKLSEIGAACMSLCEAIVSVASLWYQYVSPTRSALPLAVDRLLSKRVAPKRHVDRMWTSLRHDPKGSFPVDFHMNGIGEPRNVFAVTSSSKSIMVVAVVNFLRSHRLNFPTLAVIDKNANLGNRDTNRLQLTVNELVHGLDGHEDKIVKFSLSGAK